MQKYLVDEIQEVYRLQGVNINDKHVEVISRQMMRWFKVEDPGDTEFLLEEQVDRFRFRDENERIKADGGKPAIGPPAVARHHQSVARDRFVYLGGLLPGDHASADGSLHPRRGGPSARPQRECHHGPPDPGRNGTRTLPQFPAAYGSLTVPEREAAVSEGEPGEAAIPPSPGIAAELMDDDEARQTQ